ncbi:MAG TPA: hypothetical protein VEO95_10315 [Chthoniobacteraceae bacterium]|nr:hypothetical protein [Chthoniobacteraceae bacterium]
MKSEPKSKTAAALPLKPVAEELAFLRKSFKELISAYATQVESEIAQIQILITGETDSKKKFPASRVADLRDMLMLLRNFDIKPARGRRRDLKKVESLVQDMRDIVDRWS